MTDLRIIDTRPWTPEVGRQQAEIRARFAVQDAAAAARAEEAADAEEAEEAEARANCHLAPRDRDGFRATWAIAFATGKCMDATGRYIPKAASASITII